MLRTTLLISVLAMTASVGFAAEKHGAAPHPTATGGKNAMPEPPPFSPEREAKALEFVGRHHPDLAPVLQRLKGLNRAEYEQAIRELFETSERLAVMKPLDEALHGLMLEAWQVDSEIKLLAARYSVAARKDPAVEARLRELLYRQIDLQRRQVEHNRDRALATLKGMEANIKLLADNREEFVQRRFQNLIQVRKQPAGPAHPKPSASAGGPVSESDRTNQ